MILRSPVVLFLLCHPHLSISKMSSESPQRPLHPLFLYSSLAEISEKFPELVKTGKQKKENGVTNHLEMPRLSAAP